MSAVHTPGEEIFAASRECFETIVSWLDGGIADELTHAQLEDELDSRGRQLMRRLFQDHLNLRAREEQQFEQVVDGQGTTRRIETGHRWTLSTVFGQARPLEAAVMPDAP